MSIEHDKQAAKAMIELYCRKHHSSTEMCDECSTLLEYVDDRLDKCPLRDCKPTCQQCHIHCYNVEMREKVTMVMRFSGPRMLFYHPLLALRHLLQMIRLNR